MSPAFSHSLTALLIDVGSLQLCPDIPDDVKAVYRTAWDLDPTDLIDMAADRAPFIDQSQSLTLGIRRPTPELMVSSDWLCPLVCYFPATLTSTYACHRRISCYVLGEPA